MPRGRDILVGAMAATAFGLGVVGFANVRPPGGGEPDGLLPALYHALGLFVLSPSPRGLPAGDPAWAVAALWIAHFAAPLSLATALVDAALSLVRRRAPSFRGRQDHTIVCGLGRTALLAVEEIVRSGSPRDAVVVELFADNLLLARVRELGAGVILGDMTQEDTLRRAGIEGARRLLALSRDDIVNLNVAALARGLARARDFAACAQVADGKLTENLPESLKRDVRLLNTHEVAAAALVRESRLTHGYEESYVVAGFGGFGQALLKALLEEESSRGDRVFVADRDADQKVRGFLETYGFEGRSVRPVRGDLHDPALWQAIREALAEPGAPAREPVVLVCTDNDVSNLSLALSIRRRYVKEATIYCRLFGEVAFEEEMVRGHNIQTYRVADLLRRNLPPDLLGRKRA